MVNCLIEKLVKDCMFILKSIKDQSNNQLNKRNIILIENVGILDIEYQHSHDNKILKREWKRYYSIWWQLQLNKVSRFIPMDKSKQERPERNCNGFMTGARFLT